MASNGSSCSETWSSDIIYNMRSPFFSLNFKLKRLARATVVLHLVFLEIQQLQDHQQFLLSKWQHLSNKKTKSLFSLDRSLLLLQSQQKEATMKTSQKQLSKVFCSKKNKGNRKRQSRKKQKDQKPSLLLWTILESTQLLKELLKDEPSNPNTVILILDFVHS